MDINKLTVITLCGLGAAASAYMLIRQPNARPDIEVRPGHSIELGILKQDAEKTFSFKLTNTTDSEIDIVEASVSCNCVKPSISKGKIEAGGSTDISFTFRTARQRGDGQVYSIVAYRKGANSHLNSLELFAKYRIDPEVRLNADHLSFRSSTTEKQQVIATTVNGEMPVIVEAASTATFLEIDLARGSQGIAVISFDRSKVTAGMRNGQVKLKIKYAGEKSDLISIPVEVLDFVEKESR